MTPTGGQMQGMDIVVDLQGRLAPLDMMQYYALAGLIFEAVLFVIGPPP